MNCESLGNLGEMHYLGYGFKNTRRGGGRSSWRPGAVALYGFPALPMFGEVVKKR